MSNRIIKEIKRGERDYPERLEVLKDDAPEVLYCIGDAGLLNMPAAAVVGARKASQYGKWAAYGAGKKLAEYDIVTVSGMAAGCDAQAHKGAVEAGGKTIAVLGSGADICYPASNRKLYETIAEEGLIITENRPGTPPMNFLFPKRNRIISALSDLVIIAEAGEKSGSLITAGFALDLGKDIMAFPSNINNALSRGCNMLIRDGAIPVTDHDDIILQMGLTLKNVRLKRSVISGESAEKAYELIRLNGSITPDELARELNAGIREINRILTELELGGYIKMIGGRVYVNS